MKKLLIAFIVLASPLFVSAAELELEQLNSCELAYAGDICTIDLNLTNNVEDMLVDATFIVDYTGMCGDSWDGIGITAKLNHEVLDTQFNFPSGLTPLELDIDTDNALCPGSYSFRLELAGEDNVVSSGGGGFSSYASVTPLAPEITHEETLELIKKELQGQPSDLLHDGGTLDVSIWELIDLLEAMDPIVTSTSTVASVVEVVEESEEDFKLPWYIVLIIVLIIIWIIYSVTKKK